MIDWLKANVANIFVLLLLFLYGCVCVRSIVSNKKKGKPSCGGNCASCSFVTCHRPKSSQ